MDRKSKYCSCCSGKSKLTRCNCKCKTQLGDFAKFSGRSSPGRFTSSWSKNKDNGHGQDFHAKPCQNDNVAKYSGKSESQTRVCSLNSEQKGQGSFTEPYGDAVMKQPSSSRYGHKSTGRPQYHYWRSIYGSSYRSSLPQRSSEPVERLNQALSLTSFSEANRAKQPSSLKSACKPANEKSRPPTFSQLVDKKSGQPVRSKSTYKPRTGGSHRPGSSNPAVKERLEKPARAPCPVNEGRSVSGKRGVTEDDLVQDFLVKPCQDDNVAKDSGKSESQTGVCSLNSEQKGKGSFTEPYADAVTKQPSSWRYGHKSTGRPQYHYLRSIYGSAYRSSLPQRSSEPLVKRSNQASLSLASFTEPYADAVTKQPSSWRYGHKSTGQPQYRRSIYGSSSEANRAKQPSSLKSACKPANERSPLPTFSQLVDKKSGQPIRSKSTYKPRSGGSHLPGSSNPAVKERLEKPARSPCPVNEGRTVSGKRGVTEEIPPHGNGVKEGVNSKHNVEAFDELADIARVALKMLEGLNRLHSCLDLRIRQQHQGEEFHNSPADRTSPSPSNAVCGKCHISPGGHWVEKWGLENTMEQGKSLSLSTRVMKVQSAYDNIASTARRMGINVDDIAESSS